MQRTNFELFLIEIAAATSESVVDQCLRLCQKLTPPAITEVTIVNQLLLWKAGHLTINNHYGFRVRGELTFLTLEDWRILAKILRLLAVTKLVLLNCTFTCSPFRGKMCWHGLLETAQKARLNRLILPGNELIYPEYFMKSLFSALKANIAYPLEESSLLKSCARFFVRKGLTAREIAVIPTDIIEVIEKQKGVVSQADNNLLTYHLY